jgi:hypothetical protein
MKTRIPFLIAALGLSLGASTVMAQQAPSDDAKGLAAWAKVYAVFSHPRCANCHVEDNRPRWSGAHYGPSPRIHAFNVQGGEKGKGVAGQPCAACHGEHNTKVLHGPPGAHDWHLAPAEMVWFGKSSAYICGQIKDPARNGNRTLEAVALHVRDDKLVAWGWDPGPGREPAPGSAEEAFAALKEWTAAGAPCPPN